MSAHRKLLGSKVTSDLLSEDFLRKLAQLLREEELSEIECQDGEKKIRLSKQSSLLAPAATFPAPALSAAIAPPQASAASVHPSQEKQSTAHLDQSQGTIIRSPMVGTAYLSPAPDNPPFTSVGDRIEEGKTALIVEAMKVMNPIKASASGTVTAIHVKSGDPVEFDQPLLQIKPD